MGACSRRRVFLAFFVSALGLVISGCGAERRMETIPETGAADGAADGAAAMPELPVGDGPPIAGEAAEPVVSDASPDVVPLPPSAPEVAASEPATAGADLPPLPPRAPAGGSAPPRDSRPADASGTTIGAGSRIVAGGAAVAGGGGGATSPSVVIRHSGLPAERHGYSSERVFFITNREQADEAESRADPDLYFGATIGTVTWGACEVSMPYRRERGTLPEPSLLKLEFSQDPARHVVLMQIELLGQAEFSKQLQQRMASSPEQQLLVFVHGYSASFRDAARRTAQLAYDLNYQGPAMFFSWPAGSASEGLNRWNYLNDLRRADESQEDFISVLESLGELTGARRIHLVAHSMGNHLLTESLKTMVDRRGGPEAVRPLFDAVAMAAPDVNAREFVDRTASRIRGFSQRITVYASRNDKALKFSHTVNGWDPLGTINKSSLRLAGIKPYELVDASAVADRWFDSGHIYYGDMPEVISDVRCVFQGLSIARRGLLATPPALRLVRHNR